MKLPSFVSPRRFAASALCCSLLAASASCALMPRARSEKASPVPPSGEPSPVHEPLAPRALPPAPLVLTFAGDIMAHRCNYSMLDPRRIYDDVRELLNDDDLSFGNLEMPVDDALPQSTYPRFNVHTPYVEAAVSGGFDALSLANNHSNDQGSASMKATLKAVSAISGISLASGLRAETGAPMEAAVTQVRDFEVAFLAVTELLNSYDPSKNLVYHVPPRPEEREALVNTVKALRVARPEALFVLSIHVNEAEYGRAVSASKRAWFTRLAEAGIDVVWAHHPHVMQGWEVIDTGARKTLVMYSMGNFISGQRWETDRANPSGYREYTGDAVLLRVSAERVGSGAGKKGFEFAILPISVTNWLDPREGLVVRRTTERFINSLPAVEAAYYRERWRLMRAYLPVTVPAD